MPRITLIIKSENKVNSLITVEELRSNYLTGIKLEANLQPFPESVYENWIDYAAREVERFLSIKLPLQVITESKNYSATDYSNFGYVRATYPVVVPLQMTGFYGSVEQIDYPQDWLSVRKSSDDESYSRHINVMPNTGQQVQMSGLFANLGLVGRGLNTPNYWTIRYVTGFPNLPLDIKAAIGMLAAINILTVANESMANALGYLGTSSKSVSIDGLSQSVSMYANGTAGIFGSRIKQYSDLLTNPENGLLKKLQDYYGSILWTTA